MYKAYTCPISEIYYKVLPLLLPLATTTGSPTEWQLQDEQFSRLGHIRSKAFTFFSSICKLIPL